MPRAEPCSTARPGSKLKCASSHDSWEQGPPLPANFGVGFPRIILTGIVYVFGSTWITGILYSAGGPCYLVGYGTSTATEHAHGNRTRPYPASFKSTASISRSPGRGEGGGEAHWRDGGDPRWDVRCGRGPDGKKAQPGASTGAGCSPRRGRSFWYTSWRDQGLTTGIAPLLTRRALLGPSLFQSRPRSTIRPPGQRSQCRIFFPGGACDHPVTVKIWKPGFTG